ncbi:MAG: hypothetical protein A2W11_12200 [Ignavibacteria bacterium RBG_16_35_7]|nr:MAG: hypothetical protein A2W11_12200 [Ignavibacteria bacterium RBG_16_35_7]
MKILWQKRLPSGKANKLVVRDSVAYISRRQSSGEFSIDFYSLFKGNLLGKFAPVFGDRANAITFTVDSNHDFIILYNDRVQLEGRNGFTPRSRLIIFSAQQNEAVKVWHDVEGTGTLVDCNGATPVLGFMSFVKDSVQYFIKYGDGKNILLYTRQIKTPGRLRSIYLAIGRAPWLFTIIDDQCALDVWDLNSSSQFQQIPLSHCNNKPYSKEEIALLSPMSASVVQYDPLPPIVENIFSEFDGRKLVIYKPRPGSEKLTIERLPIISNSIPSKFTIELGSHSQIIGSSYWNGFLYLLLWNSRDKTEQLCLVTLA